VCVCREGEKELKQCQCFEKQQRHKTKQHDGEARQSETIGKNRPHSRGKALTEACGKDRVREDKWYSRKRIHRTKGEFRKLQCTVRREV